MDGLNAHADGIGKGRDGDAVQVQVSAEEHGADIFTAMVNKVNHEPASASPDWPHPIARDSFKYNDVSNRIRELRKALGLSLSELARRVGTSPQQLYRLENGERRLAENWMRRIAAGLGVRPGDLLVEAREVAGELVQSKAELSLLRFWRAMPTEQKRWLIAAARDYGFNLVNNNDGPRNQPKARSARS